MFAIILQISFHVLIVMWPTNWVYAQGNFPTKQQEHIKVSIKSGEQGLFDNSQIRHNRASNTKLGLKFYKTK